LRTFSLTVLMKTGHEKKRRVACGKKRETGWP